MIIDDLDNEKGQGLISVIISLGLLGILASVFATMMTSQTRELTRLNQKQEILDFTQTLLTTFQNPQNCSWQVAGARLSVYDEFGTATSTVVFPKLYSGINATSPLLAQEKSLMPGTQTQLAVDTITLTQLQALDPPAASGGTPPEYWKGVWEITFSSPQGFSFRPLRVTQIVRADSIPFPGNTSLVSCFASNGVTSLNGRVSAMSCYNINVPMIPSSSGSALSRDYVCNGPGGDGLTGSAPYSTYLLRAGCWGSQGFVQSVISQTQARCATQSGAAIDTTTAPKVDLFCCQYP